MAFPPARKDPGAGSRANHLPLRAGHRNIRPPDPDRLGSKLEYHGLLYR